MSWVLKVGSVLIWQRMWESEELCARLRKWEQAYFRLKWEVSK